MVIVPSIPARLLAHQSMGQRTQIAAAEMQDVDCDEAQPARLFSDRCGERVSDRCGERVLIGSGPLVGYGNEMAAVHRSTSAASPIGHCFAAQSAGFRIETRAGSMMICVRKPSNLVL
jgi:hypothetical protein